MNIYTRPFFYKKSVVPYIYLGKDVVIILFGIVCWGFAGALLGILLV